MAGSRGRPLRADAPSKIVVGVRLTPEERDLLRQAAGFEPLASWIRRMALDAARPPKRNR